MNLSQIKLLSGMIFLWYNNIMFLNMHAAPSEPLSIEIQGVGATVLHVTWRAPLDNGGRPILKYRIALREIPTSFLVEVGSNTFNFVIRRVNLAENTTYK